MSQTGTRALPGRCFRPCLASEPAKVGLGPLGSGIVESRVSQALGGGGEERNPASSSLVDPGAKLPRATGSSRLLTSPSPRAPIQIPCVGGVERKRSPGQLELVISLCLVSEQKSNVNCYGKGMLHSGASFILQLAQEMCVCFNRPISPFINHPFCRLSFSSLKYEKLRV